MGAFSVVLTNQQLQQLCALLLQKISAEKNKVTLIQCLSLMANAVGNKLALFLKDIVIMLTGLINSLNREQSIPEENDLIEVCLATITSIVKKCPREVTPFVAELTKLSFSLITHDPNYMYNEDVDMKEDDGYGEEWGSDFEDYQQDAVDDDDDTSWKVRRGAIRLLDAIIKTRPDQARQIAYEHSKDLVARFKERVDDVKCDILDMFRNLTMSCFDARPGTVENELVHSASLVRQKSHSGVFNKFSG